MDWITHSAAGASIAWALPRHWVGPKAARIAIAGALLPDLDMYIEPYLAPGSAFEHRALTHSLFGVAVLAPVIALVPHWLSKEKRGYARLVALIAAGILSHVVLDLPTEIGSKVFYPFSRKTVYVDWLGHIDFTLFMLGLFVFLAVWTYAKSEAATRRGLLSSVLLASVGWFFFATFPVAVHSSASLGPTREPFSAVYPSEPFITVYPLVLGGVLLGLLAAFARQGWGFRENPTIFGRFGLAAFSIYLLVCGAAKWVALNQIEQFTRERDIHVLARATTRLEPSSLVAPLRWTGLVLAPDGVYKAEVSPFSARPPVFRFFPNATESAFVARARSTPSVQAFLSTARFPVSCHQMDGSQHVVEFYDHAAGVGVLQVVLNERLEMLGARWIGYMEYPPGETPPPWTWIPPELREPLAQGNTHPDVVFRVASASPCFFTRDARVSLQRAPRQP